jgi:CO dehydrogenase/acetyl-CoA synthase epsilon subunit
MQALKFVFAYHCTQKKKKKTLQPILMLRMAKRAKRTLMHTSGEDRTPDLLRFAFGVM